MFSCPNVNRLYRDFELLSGVRVEFRLWNTFGGGNIQYMPAKDGLCGVLMIGSGDRRELLHEIAHWAVGNRDKIEYGLPTQEQQEEGAQWGYEGELQTLALGYFWQHLAGEPPYVSNLSAVTGSRAVSNSRIQGLFRCLPHAARYSARLPPTMVELIVEICRYLPDNAIFGDERKLQKVIAGLLTRLYGSHEVGDDYDEEQVA